MLAREDVAAVIVTRGNVDMEPILASLPYDEVVVWDNSVRPYNLGVMGRWAAFSETTKPVVFTQDDDCIITPEGHERLLAEYQPGVLTGIMPIDHAAGEAHCLVGWGALIDRELPERAFARWLSGGGSLRDMFDGHCDMIVGALTPHLRVDGGPEAEWHKTAAVPFGQEVPTLVHVAPYMFANFGRMHGDPGHDENRARIYQQSLRILSL